MTDIWTFHGGRLAAAKSIYGDGPEPWLDLSTGINPRAWPLVETLPIDWQRLPDEHALRTLEETAAHFFGVDPQFIAALPGSEIGLRLMGDVLKGAARHASPSYRTHAEMFNDSTAACADTIEHASEGVVVLANPNNPDGRIIQQQALLSTLCGLQENHGWLIIDEAFADARPEASLAQHVADDLPLVIFRSFGKFFGLAGVRLGFMLGPCRIVAKIRKRLGSWPVSSAAMAIGTAAYNDGAWIAATRHWLREEAASFDRMLVASGFESIGDCPLFRLIQTQNATALFDRLARQAILTRPFDYNAGWLRLGLPGSDTALERLRKALAHA